MHDFRGELLERIARAARDGAISAEDAEFRIANVRSAGSAEELDLIRRDLDRWQPDPSVTKSEATIDVGDGPLLLPVADAAGPEPPWLPSAFLRRCGDAPGVRWLASALLLAVMFVVGVTITWAYRSMRAVLDVGGACADGGPYVSAQPCPAGAWLLGAAIPALLLVTLLGAVVAVALRAPSPLLVMWGALFGALGWNFFDYGRRDGTADFLVCAVVFWLMAAPALVALPFGAAIRPRGWGAIRGTAPTLLTTWAWLLAYAVAGGVGVRLGWAWWSRLA